MMGHREKLKGGDEYDALTKWHRFLYWKPKIRRLIKRKFNKRIRKNTKLLLRNYNVK